MEFFSKGEFDLIVIQLATYDIFPGGKIRFLSVRLSVSRLDLLTFGMGGKIK